MDNIVFEKDDISIDTLTDLIGLSCAALVDNNPTLRRVMLLPPDFTRLHSYAGVITRLYYDTLSSLCEVIHIMPALGTHEPMTLVEVEKFFGEGAITHSVIAHNWRDDVVSLGHIPGDFVNEVSDGILNEPIDVSVNRRIVNGYYDLVISIGQVVPHEVVGMANYTKNIVVGCGGASFINASHMLGASYGMERIMGRDFSPVRKVFDYAEQHFLSQYPIVYALTVTTNDSSGARLHGLYIGRERKIFEQAVKRSQQKNISYVSQPLNKVVVFLDPDEFKSTWLGNKAIYRTRMAIADGGQLIILAPGVNKFGEDKGIDALIRRYGYIGRENILRLARKESDLANNLSAAAHLIHGSSDGRFEITYAAGGLSRGEIEEVGFAYGDLDELMSRYNPARLTDGFNEVEGEMVFYISNPALGLWMVKPDNSIM
ncbi:MAG: lactate racemase domain-containing protein [Clostridiales bacterium]|jgi:nickel-dependent lactate racemase|nr:lactate racemase domain-containing protein [Clostridiales bacterium]